MKEVVDKHYKRLAKDYDEFLYYSPSFVRALTTMMVDKLQLDPEERLVDLGCGTGMYSLDILKQITLKRPVIGVDPFPEMLAHIPEDAPVERVVADGLLFSEQPGTYDKILIKETVHHIADRPKLFRNLFERLRPNGRLLLVHVPPKVEYPLFEKALERCENWHANPDEMERQLKEVAFSVERDVLRYEHKIPKEHYFKMVEGCYMSALTSLSPEELREGLDEMREKYRELDVLEFIDHFDYITAVRAGETATG